MRVVFEERSMLPVPLNHLMATGIGLTLGVVLDISVGALVAGDGGLPGDRLALLSLLGLPRR